MVFCVGTKWGRLHLLDALGNELPCAQFNDKFSVAINQVEIKVCLFNNHCFPKVISFKTKCLLWNIFFLDFCRPCRGVRCCLLSLWGTCCHNWPLHKRCHVERHPRNVSKCHSNRSHLCSPGLWQKIHDRFLYLIKGHFI